MSESFQWETASIVAAADPGNECLWSQDWRNGKIGDNADKGVRFIYSKQGSEPTFSTRLDGIVKKSPLWTLR
ncbi:hypothetical protein [Lysobacter tyrosinilyticus]